MKKLFLFLLGVFTIILFVTLPIVLVNKYYSVKINGIYYDKIGDDVSVEKNQGIQLQKKSLDRGDNLLIYGSSELTISDIPSSPANFFKDKANGFQVNLVGRGHCQNIIHAINFAALGSELKQKKIVFLISPQWFNKTGISSEEFMMNFSELQFYTFMKSKSISDDLKLELVNRIKPFLNPTEKTYLYATLYFDNSISHKLAFNLLKPYFALRCYALETKDKRVTYLELEKYSASKPVLDKKLIRFNWDEELKKAENKGKAMATNNEYYIYDEYYNKYVKDRYIYYKNSVKYQSFTESPEYKDLQLLLKICRAEGIKPLFVGVPVNGKWCDYIGFEQSSRAAYYSKLDNIINSYGFKVLDLSNHEYEPYLMSDTMHLGWKGWIYIDREISRYFNEN